MIGNIQKFSVALISIFTFFMQTGCASLFENKSSSLTFEKLDQRFSEFTLEQRISYLDLILSGTSEFLPDNASAHRLMLEVLNKQASFTLDELKKMPSPALQQVTWVPLNQTDHFYKKYIALINYYAIYKENLAYGNKNNLLDTLSIQASLRLAVLDEVFKNLQLQMSSYPVLFPASDIAQFKTTNYVDFAVQYKMIAEQSLALGSSQRNQTLIKNFQLSLNRYFSNNPDEKKWTSHQLGNSKIFQDAKAFAFSLSPKDSSEIDGYEAALDPIVRAQVSLSLLKSILLSLPDDRRPATDESEDELAETPTQQVAPAPKIPARTYSNTILIGLTPGQYIKKDKNQMYLVAIEVANRTVRSITEVTPQDVAKIKAQNPRKIFVELTSSSASVKTPDMYDVIYPGLINLHNHTKQNVLPIWSEARGQFENRFEWRDWNVYKLSVSKNMNPWISFGPAISCAAFRYSELQGIIGGVTYQQGFSTADAIPCVDGFGVNRIEDASAFSIKKDAVRAPTDLISPSDFTYVWEVLRPLIRTGMSYEAALAQEVKKSCPQLAITANNVNTNEGLKILQDKASLVANCAEPLHKKFIRYVSWAHPTVASAKRTLNSPNRSAFIVHLGEGRRLDIYNRAEFEMIKLLGLDLPNMNFVHGVGLDADDFSLMGKKGMGLVWSPFSNLLLYNETLDIRQASANRIPIALGTDWVPTGTKNLLEELKVAKAYVQSDPEGENLAKIFTDELLYNMVTENPARIINQWAPNSGVGKIAVGTMGSFVVLKRNHPNPFTNLVVHGTEKDVNLVVSDGDLVYGNRSYFQQAGITAFEIMNSEIANSDQASRDSTIPTLLEPNPTPAAKLAHLNRLGVVAAQYPFTLKDDCKMLEPKVLSQQNTLSYRPALMSFFQSTKINLDRFSDIQKLLALTSTSQGLNRTDGVPSNDRYALTALPSLYTCNNSAHGLRLSSMFEKSMQTFEFTSNRNRREGLRKELRLGRTIEELNKIYRE